MIKVEKIDVWGFEHAIRGMRNPMNSWDKSDSGYNCVQNEKELCDPHCTVDNYCDRRMSKFIIGKNDLALMRRLYKAGSEHRKYLRQIFVFMDITAPLYWWKEMDTYKVGTVANSCSTMHKIADKEFEPDDFSHEHLGDKEGLSFLRHIIRGLNMYREEYLSTKDKKWWWQMIQLLPSSYNQKRTITMNYENVITIIKQRTGHKLDEWNNFVKVLKDLPYIEEIMKDEKAS